MNENIDNSSIGANKDLAINEKEVLFSKFSRLKNDLLLIESNIAVTNNEYAEKISGLQTQKHSIEQALFHIKALLKLEGYEIEKEPESYQTSKELLDQPMSVRDAAYELLKELHQPLHYIEITSKLIERNIVIPGKSPDATLLSKISRDKRFRRTKRRGVYTLASPSTIFPRKHKTIRH